MNGIGLISCNTFRWWEQFNGGSYSSNSKSEENDISVHIGILGDIRKTNRKTPMD